MKFIFILIGFVAFGIGTVGIFCPIVPTVPFYLLSTVMFAKGSPKLEKWLKNTKFYKNNISSFSRTKGLTIAKKLKILVILTIVILVAFFMMKNTIGRSVLIAVWICHLIGIMFVVRTDKSIGKDNE